jgi:GNAT superfamily N-acetyltransferase
MMIHSTLSAVARSNHAYYKELCTVQTLDWGVAHFGTEFPTSHACNQIRDVLAIDDNAAEAAIDATERVYAQKQRTCYRWAMAMDQPSERMAPHLVRRGYTAMEYTAMRLEQWPEAPPRPEAYRILPARPMRQAFRETYLRQTDDLDGQAPEVLADVACERLNDVRLTLLVAMAGTQPVGRCGLHLIGDLACIRELHVLKDARGRGAATALLAHVIAMARRLTMNVVCVQVPADARPARSLLEKHGFVADGILVEFHRS